MDQILSKVTEIMESEKVDEVFITSDLQGFLIQNFAINHSKTLGDSKIHHIVKNEDGDAEIFKKPVYLEI